MTLFSSLLGRLRPAGAKKRTFADVTDFRDFVIAALKKQAGVDKVVPDSGDPAKFAVTIGGQESTGDVTNIFGYLNAYPDEDTDKTVERFIRSLNECLAKTVTDGSIVAVIRTRDYVDYVKGQGIEILFEPLGADLVIVYMADRPDSMSPLAPKDVSDKDLQTIRTTALANIRQWLPKVVADGQLKLGVLYVVEENTMLSTSLILLDDFWTSIAARFPGDVLIALPRKDQLFIFEDGNSAAKKMALHLIDTTTRENFNLLSEKLYARHGGKIGFAVD